MIQDLQLSVCGQIIEPVKCKLVQNTTNEYRLIFNFDSSWSNLTKTVILKNVGESRFKIEDDGSVVEAVLDSNNSVIIPAQLLKDSGYIAVTAKGLSSDGNELRLTEKYNRYIYVDAQGDYEGGDAEEFNQSLYTQIQTIATSTSLLRDDLEAKKQADYWRGEKGDPFTYSDFTQEQIDGLKIKGDKGDPFVYSDFTQEQLNGLKVKGDKGDAFTYADFTQEQIDGLKVKGDKGDAFTYADFTQEQIDNLKSVSLVLGSYASVISVGINGKTQEQITISIPYAVYLGHSMIASAPNSNADVSIDFGGGSITPTITQSTATAKGLLTYKIPANTTITNDSKTLIFKYDTNKQIYAEFEWVTSMAAQDGVSPTVYTSQLSSNVTNKSFTYDSTASVTGYSYNPNSIEISVYQTTKNITSAYTDGYVSYSIDDGTESGLVQLSSSGKWTLAGLAKDTANKNPNNKIRFTVYDSNRNPISYNTTIVTQDGQKGSATYDDTSLRQLINGKQDSISDLETIRSGAAAGSTALQPEIEDAGNYFTTKTVEGALQQLGSELQGAVALLNNI